MNSTQMKPMTKFKILNRWTRETICEIEADSLGGAVEKAVGDKISLRDANLRAADLSYANLRYANLRDANLRDANLRDANLRDANLRDANLRDANLSYADLRAADLRAADLSYANLRAADLSYANLSYADLRDANLRAADLSYANLRAAILTPVRDDLWAVLSAAPKEVEGLRLALIEGRIDGSQYTGDCCCLVGTIANVRSCDYHDLGLLKPNAQRPSERFFLGIKKGDRPDTNQFSKLALEWIDTWLANMREAFGPDTKEAA